MASEDHDFEEISSFNDWNKTLSWETNTSRAVGRIDPASLEEVIIELEQLLGNRGNGEAIIKLFKDVYLGNNSLAAAHRQLVHELYGSHGLVVIEPDDKQLK